MNRIAVAQELIKLAREMLAESAASLGAKAMAKDREIRRILRHGDLALLPKLKEERDELCKAANKQWAIEHPEQNVDRGPCKLAKELVGKDERELRIMTMEDVMSDTPLLRLKVVFKGTMDEVNDYAKKKGLVWKDSRKQIFGGYWHDKDNGNAYPIT